MELFTERLRIREMTEDDWQAAARIIADFAGSDAAAYDCPPSAEETSLRRWIAGMGERRLLFAVLPRESGEIAGYVCFHEDGGVYDLGYCFHRESQGKGYALESCGALLRHMTEARGIRKFSAGTALENRPSVRLLERLGFVLTGTETVSFQKDPEGNDVSFTGGRFLYDPSQRKTD